MSKHHYLNIFQMLSQAVLTSFWDMNWSTDSQKSK